jgi:hypothetical protein
MVIINIVNILGSALLFSLVDMSVIYEYKIRMGFPHITIQCHSLAGDGCY